MMPNLEPEVILPRLASWLGEGDALLLSANLARGRITRRASSESCRVMTTR